LSKKVMSGEDVKAPLRDSEKSPQELKVQEGIGQRGRLTLFLVVTDRCSD
jgi:hypothetical protein